MKIQREEGFKNHVFCVTTFTNDPKVIHKFYFKHQFCQILTMHLRHNFLQFLSTYLTLFSWWKNSFLFYSSSVSKENNQASHEAHKDTVRQKKQAMMNKKREKLISINVFILVCNHFPFSYHWRYLRCFPFCSVIWWRQRIPLKTKWMEERKNSFSRKFRIKFVRYK